jgi:4-amino-4-deoxy-L-arabinose transferase-like glycosyltransferase
VASLSLSVTSVLLAAGVGKQLFPNKPLLRWQLPLTLIFHPQFVFVGAYANNDSTAIAVASAILLLSMESVEKGLKFWRTLLIGFLTGWLILTKYNAYAIIPAAFCSLLLSGYRRKLPLKAIALHLSLLIGTALSLSSWWFIRNCQLFQGDLTGSRTLLRTWTETYHKSVDARGSLWTVISQSRWWRMNFFSFWGWFGYMTRSLPRPFYYGYLAFLALAFAGGLRFFRTGLPNTFVTMRSFALKQNEANCWRTASLERVLWLPVWLTVLANFALAIYGTASGVSGPQGRYFFVSEIPLIALLLAGLDQLPGASGRFAVLAFAAFNIVSYLYATWFLFSLYGFGGVCR